MSQQHSPATAAKPLRILLVNDDGAPSPHSPHVLGLYRTLIGRGHSVSVVLPSSQKSWGSMAFSVTGKVGMWWFDPPSDTYGKQGTWHTEPKKVAPGDEQQWVLLDGSPTTCTNVGLFNGSLLHPDDPDATKPFDIVVSGPNLGRNTGAAFCLSSGTLGAAMAAALSGVKAISLSYAHFQTIPPSIQAAIDAQDQNDTASSDMETQLKAERAEAKSLGLVASKRISTLGHELSVDLIERLYSSWEPEVGVYGINVPLVDTLKQPKIYWTSIWQNSYPRLFNSVASSSSTSSSTSQQQQHLPREAPPPTRFLSFQPDMGGMMVATDDPNAVGTDTWAIMNGHVSVTKLKPLYQEVAPSTLAPSNAGGVEGQRWRL